MKSENKERDFDQNGIHKITGTKYDPLGYDQDGFNQLGINREGYLKWEVLYHPKRLMKERRNNRGTRLQ